MRRLCYVGLIIAVVVALVSIDYRRVNSIHKFCSLKNEEILYIYGTNTRTNEQKQIYQAGIRNAISHGFKCKPDTEVTGEDIQTKNLIIVGTPKSNLFLKKMISDLPVCVKKDTIDFWGETFVGKNIAAVFVCPSPLNSQKLCLVFLSSDLENLLNVRSDDDYDYLIVDRFGVICRGFFDKKDSMGWRLDKRRTYYVERPIWLLRESPHYVFHFLPGSLSAKDIDKIVERQETAYRKIIQTLHVDFPDKIQFYLYNSNQQKGILTGNYGNAHANNKYNEAHVVYSTNLKSIGEHEVTHIISSRIGEPPPLFGEGLALYMEGYWWDKPLHWWARKFLREGELVPLDQLLETSKFFTNEDRITYPEAGSFVSFIIEKYGMKHFLAAYANISGYDTQADIRRKIVKIYSKSLEGLEKEWIHHLTDIDY